MLKSRKAKIAAGAAAVFVLLAPAFARAYTINGPSMAPTLRFGDVVISFLAAYDLRFPYTDKVLFSIDDPNRGDIVIYHDRVKDAVAAKRVVGLPGDRVEVRGNRLVVNDRRAGQETLPAVKNRMPAPAGDPLGEVVAVESVGEASYLVTYSGDTGDLANHGPIVVPAGKYFLLGDNRDNSADSRLIGCIDREQVKGRVVYGQRTP